MTGASLTPVEDAVRIVLGEVLPMPAEQVDLVEAEGRVLAQVVTSTEAVPSADNSAMDGFALVAADTAGAEAGSPARLELAGESRAGAPFQGRLEPGQAVRISTGAVIPDGADSVLRFEDSIEESSSLIVSAPVPLGNNVRRAGEDVQVGDLVLQPGTFVGAAELGVLASVGVARPLVARRPRAAVLSTGDELIGPDEPMRPGAVRNSNAHTAPALVRAAGAEVSMVQMVPDDLRATEGAIRAALADDIVILCGGVSVGPHDHVKPALEALGVEQRFWRVALKPGKPMWFGVAEEAGTRTLVFGLPGNPVSVMITFELFVRPAIAAMLGQDLPPHTVPAVLEEDYRKQPGRAEVVRLSARLEDGRWHVRPTTAQGSHVLTSMLNVDALLLVPADSEGVAAGTVVDVALTPRALLH
ncbi:MAG: molybdopterin molybdotransferase [Thermoleophilaceae bacterium]|nr:molybdopterin molybdotransferase [Thermoleophilaceae bacterium]